MNIKNIKILVQRLLGKVQHVMAGNKRLYELQKLCFVSGYQEAMEEMMTRWIILPEGTDPFHGKRTISGNFYPGGIFCLWVPTHHWPWSKRRPSVGVKMNYRSSQQLLRRWSDNWRFEGLLIRHPFFPTVHLPGAGGLDQQGNLLHSAVFRKQRHCIGREPAFNSLIQTQPTHLSFKTGARLWN